MHTNLRIAILSLVYLLPAFGLPCQSWTDKTPELIDRRGAGFVYQTSTQRFLLFGGTYQSATRNSTWEHDGQRWLRLNPAQSPSPRSSACVGYDSGRNRVILFGGGSTLNDTWEWDGTTWRQVSPQGAIPPARSGGAMCYDPSTSRLLMHGGFGAASLLADTWAWTGTGWTAITSSVTPPARGSHAMGFDGTSITMFGGADANGNALGDTWQLRSTGWIQLTASGPPSRHSHAMSFHAATNRLLMHGGRNNQVGGLADLWEWSGVSWTQRASTIPAGARSQCGMAYDSTRQRTIIFGGYPISNPFTPTGDMWEYSSNTWTQVSNGNSPAARTGHAMAMDSSRGQLVIFGGYTWMGGTYAARNDTWEFDDRGYLERVGTSPSARVHAAMTYDSNARACVLFGGLDSGGTPTDTWLLTASGWTRRTSLSAPPGRRNHAMAHDPIRGRTVLFGGVGAQGNLGDTWEWDGTIWRQLAPTVSPPARSNHTLTYDPSRGSVLLYGGAGAAALNDTWEWDGAEWRQLVASAYAGNSYYSTAVFNSSRQATVILNSDNPGEAYEWTGLGWIRIGGSVPPYSMRGVRIAFDPTRNGAWMFGGESSGTAVADLWFWQYPGSASFHVFGASCAGSAGIPWMTGSGLPRVGQTFSLSLANLAPGRPGMLAVAGSAAQWGQFRLPLSLDALGMSNCTFYTSAEVGLGFGTGTGTARIDIPISSDPRVAGIRLYCQGLALDNLANPGGLIFTNACSFLIGL